jgi:adenylate cyclase
MAKFASHEDEWRAYLQGTHPNIRFGQRTFRRIPSSPRCKMCSAPFAGAGGLLFGRLGFKPWDKNPNLCRACVTSLDKEEVSGAEIEVTFLFADVRRSSDLARRISTMEFTTLMQRFYTTASDSLIADNALIEKFVGDEVVGFFIPLLTGPNHALAAVTAAEHLLEVTGHADAEGPWLPLGAGIHTGVAFVGMVRHGTSSDFTAFGDPINVAAHVASKAPAGEILVTDEAAAAAGLAMDGLEHRDLDLKGHPVGATAVRVGAIPAA